MFPSVEVIYYAQQHVETLASIEFQSVFSITHKFIDSCIRKFKLQDLSDLIYKMVYIIDQPYLFLIKQNELFTFGLIKTKTNKKIIEYFQENAGTEYGDWIDVKDNVPDSCKGIHITPTFFKHLCLQHQNKDKYLNAFSWSEAIYSGQRILELSMRNIYNQYERDASLSLLTQSVDHTIDQMIIDTIKIDT